jgi:hypothetical protein
MMTSLAFPDRRDLRVEEYPRVTFPDFMTRANLELIESAVFSVESVRKRSVCMQSAVRGKQTYWTSLGPSLRLVG